MNEKLNRKYQKAPFIEIMDELSGKDVIKEILENKLV